MDQVPINNNNRTLHATRTLNAAVDLVWEMWTNPEHIEAWWGPNGFTDTIHKMDLHENGEWNLTMHGPDGTNYPNKSIFKEIIPFEKMVFEHFNPHFITTVKFENKNTKTLLDWSMLFDNQEMYDMVVKAHKADKGQQENLDKLEKYLSNKV